jgi:hypothetical protein
MAYNLPVELFTELGIGIVIFALRFYARWRTVGPQNFGYDDIFAGIAVVCSPSFFPRGDALNSTNCGLNRCSGSSKQRFFTHAVSQVVYLLVGRSQFNNHWFAGAKGNNIGLNETSAMQVPDSQVAVLVLGSKLAYAAWVFYILLIWSLKSVLLCLYVRLTYVPTSHANNYHYSKHTLTYSRL